MSTNKAEDIQYWTAKLQESKETLTEFYSRITPTNPDELTIQDRFDLRAALIQNYSYISLLAEAVARPDERKPLIKINNPFHR